MIEYIDNFLDEDHATMMYNTMSGDDFPWFISLRVAKEDQKQDDYYFTHMFYYSPDVRSKYFDTFIKPITDKLEAKNLIRVKGNLYTNQNKFIEHTPHQDYDFKHKGAIYCLNTCNGYTTFQGVQVNSVFNRMILFDPSEFHNSTTTTDKLIRMNINFNYE